MRWTQTPRPIRLLARVAALSAIAAIVFVTLSPIADRPVFTNKRIEHVAAFAVIGLVLGIAYPKRLVLVLIALVGSAALLEAAQHLVPGRHGRPSDFVLKSFGGTVGVATAIVANLVLATWKRRWDEVQRT